MFGKMKELMEMKKQADRIKKELDAAYVDSEEVRGVKITINGSQSIQSISIDENYLSNSDKSRIERDLVRSFNSAVKKSQALAAEKMKLAELDRRGERRRGRRPRTPVA